MCLNIFCHLCSISLESRTQWSAVRMLKYETNEEKPTDNFFMGCMGVWFGNE